MSKASMGPTEPNIFHSSYTSPASFLSPVVFFDHSPQTTPEKIPVLPVPCSDSCWAMEAASCDGSSILHLNRSVCCLKDQTAV